jgi:RNA polymerase sigma-70 factor, ECF subfamily
LDTLDEKYAKCEMQELLASALEQLKPIDKSVTVLSDLEGLSDKEIATAVGLTVSAVKSRLHRARLFLRGRVFQARPNGNSSSIVEAINHEDDRK